MGKILVILLFLGAGIGVYQLFKEHKTKQHSERNDWPSRLAPVFENHAASKVLKGKQDGGESSFFQLLYMTYSISKDGYPLVETLTRGATSAGASPIEGPLLASAIVENYKKATELGVFSDPANLLLLEQGRSPLAHTPGWEDEPLGVGFLISPTLGPELRVTLPNMVIMPISIRNAQTDLTPNNASKYYSQWLTCKMISPDTANRIQKKIRQDTLERN
ncbi:MAG: hypothetical protein KDK99_15930 [Verrucomicrobiales bacterium]|nr:hypothetical protein [Verrucomicrobiales bacterium]